MHRVAPSQGLRFPSQLDWYSAHPWLSLGAGRAGRGARLQAAAAGALAESLAGQLAALQREAVAAREAGRAAAAAAAAAAQQGAAELDAARRDAAAAAAAAAGEADALRVQAAAAEARAPRVNRALLYLYFIERLVRVLRSFVKRRYLMEVMPARPPQRPKGPYNLRSECLVLSSKPHARACTLDVKRASLLHARVAYVNYTGSAVCYAAELWGACCSFRRKAMSVCIAPGTSNMLHVLQAGRAAVESERAELEAAAAAHSADLEEQRAAAERAAAAAAAAGGRAEAAEAALCNAEARASAAQARAAAAEERARQADAQLAAMRTETQVSRGVGLGIPRCYCCCPHTLTTRQITSAGCLQRVMSLLCV